MRVAFKILSLNLLHPKNVIDLMLPCDVCFQKAKKNNYMIFHRKEEFFMKVSKLR